MALRQIGEHVYLMAYEHKHGTDHTVYDTLEAAHQSAKEIMEEYKNDWAESPEELKKFEDMLARDISEAIDHWNDGFTGNNEFILIESKNIWTCKTNIDQMKEAIDDADRA